jgi:hypothetical protein
MNVRPLRQGPAVGAALLAVIAAFSQRPAPVGAQGAPAGPAAPRLSADRSWPKRLRNNWTLGPVSGISVDARDHIWIIQRNEPVKQAGGVPAPPVIEFDAAGNIVQTWGGPGAGYEWPEQVHGITVDARDRVWITGNGDKDAQILAFTRDGKFLRQIGHQEQNGGSNNMSNVGRATQVRFDAAANEIFVSDGEMNEQSEGLDACSGHATGDRIIWRARTGRGPVRHIVARHCRGLSRQPLHG